MRRLILLLLSLVLTLPLCAETKISDLSWMAGKWGATIEGVQMEEHWTEPGGGMMIGMHRDIAQKRTSFEFIAISEGEKGLVYLAQPSGRPPTAFLLVESSENRVVFANPEHDFPKRILYWLNDGQLCARVEGDDAAEQWCWSRK